MKHLLLFTLCGFAFLTGGRLSAQNKPAQAAAQSFVFPALPYSYDALEPYIDKATVELHYDKHHRGYYTKFVAAIKGTDMETMPMETIFATISKRSVDVRNNAGGFYNHTLYWENMKPNAGGQPSADLMKVIEKQFGSFDKFKEQFSNAAKGKFGSGWAWLILTKNHELKITTTSNQDNPLMDVVEENGIPLLALDVWEHAYYLKYQNRRPEYVDAFWNLVDWKTVESRYKTALAKK